jgi:hypothetical protein
MPGRFFKQHDGVFYRTKWREASIQAEGIRRDVLVVEDAPARSTVKHFSKNTDSAFFIQVAAAASLPSQLVHHTRNPDQAGSTVNVNACFRQLISTVGESCVADASIASGAAHSNRHAQRPLERFYQGPG